MSTKIEWVKNPDGSQGITWNPITGCLNGCSYCYARKLANGRLKNLYLANNVVPHASPLIALHDPFYPRFWQSKINELADNCWLNVERRKPKGIFCCDMSDLFGKGVPDDWTRQVLEVIKSRYYDRFYLLTKQPQNMARWSPFPDNCWVGVSAWDDMSYMEAYFMLANTVQAKVKYISLEPFKGQISPGHISSGFKHINWLIIGQQTPARPETSPKIEWIEEIVTAADKAGIPVFLKHNLSRLFLNVSDFPEWARNKKTGYLRQELPAPGKPDTKEARG
jgi:protein gp37